MEKKVYLYPSIKVLATGQQLLNDTLLVYDDTVDGENVLGKEFGEDEDTGFQFKSRNVWDD